MSKSPAPSHKILNQFTSTPSDVNNQSIENIQDTLSKRSLDVAARTYEPSSKKTKYQCDFCHDAVFDSWDEAVRHEVTCGARKPPAENEKNDKDDAAVAKPPANNEKNDKNDTAVAKPATKKKRRKSKIPHANGDLTVNIPFNDGTEDRIAIKGVCTNVFLEEPMTLSEFPSRYRLSITKFLRGFGKFVW